jgi:hypothetical protein
MKALNVVLLVGGGLLAAHLLGLGVAGNTAQIVFDGITVNNPLNYTLSFLIQNVSNTTLNFNSLAGAVTLNDNPVGNVSSFPPQPVPIPGNSQTKVNVILDLSVLGTLSQALSEINNPGQTLNFEVKGNANVNSLVLPFDVTQSVTV